MNQRITEGLEDGRKRFDRVVILRSIAPSRHYRRIPDNLVPERSISNNQSIAPDLCLKGLLKDSLLRAKSHAIPFKYDSTKVEAAQNASPTAWALSE